jgi:hypothetical protein
MLSVCCVAILPGVLAYFDTETDDLVLIHLFLCLNYCV